MLYVCFCKCDGDLRDLHGLPHACPTRRSSDLEILGEGFATDPQVTGDDGLALAVINTAVQLSDHFVGEGTFPPAISTALSGDRNAFALPLPDQGALEFGERTHEDRKRTRLNSSH